MKRNQTKNFKRCWAFSSLLEPRLSEEEQVCLEKYKACTEEGELSSKELRLLNRLRIN